MLSLQALIAITYVIAVPLIAFSIATNNNKIKNMYRFFGVFFFIIAVTSYIFFIIKILSY